MKEFKIGDRVKVVNYCNFVPRIEYGMVGKVVGSSYCNSIGVEFDKNIKGHDCNGKGKQGHCWWIPAESLILLDGNKVIITTDGKTTTAKLIGNNKTMRTAVANCNPKDEFNFEIGAKLAFKRLFTADKIERFFSEEIGLRIPNEAVYMKFAEECDKRNIRWFLEQRASEWHEFSFPVYLFFQYGHICWSGHDNGNIDIKDLTTDDFDLNIESEINVGDYVFVTDKGRQYATNVDWVEKYAKDYLGKFSYNKVIPDENVNNQIYKVIAKGLLFERGKEVFGYLLESTDCYRVDYFLFDEEGIKKC